MLKDICQPFSRDIFSADQEHIVAFEQSSSACKAALKFLNNVSEQGNPSDYKIVLVQGDFKEDRPEELPVRVARSIHQHAKSKNLYMTEEIFNQIHASDIVFEQKAPLFVKALQKEIPTFSLTRFEETELKVDPTDLFDFSQVDSYSSVNQIANTGKPAPKPRDPFESSNTTLELNPVAKKKLETGKVKPLTTTGPIPAFTSSNSRVTPRPQPTAPKTQTKSIAIILVLLVLVTSAGLYLAKSKPVTTAAPANKSLPLPEIPSQTPTDASAQAPAQAAAQPSAAPAPGLTKSSVPTAPLPQVAYIHVHSAPKGADVWVNGKKMSKKTPVDNLKITTMYATQIEVQKAGYQKATKAMNLEPKETRTVMFQLVPAKKSSAAKKSKKK